MNKICRSSTHQSYPYPRTHSLVVIPPTKTIVSDKREERKFKTRPPLNRAIPPIPESRSNDSIMTQVSERHNEHLPSVEHPPSTCTAIRQFSRINPVERATTSTISENPSLSSKKLDSDESLITGIKMVHNLATKTTAVVPTQTRRSEEVPRSPLMNVAHSVRTKLTKLGNRFNRSDGNQNIPTSTSLSSMRRDPNGKIRDDPSNAYFKKSASMETGATPNITCAAPVEVSASIRQNREGGASEILNDPNVRLALNSQPPAEVHEKGTLSIQNKSTKFPSPNILRSKSGSTKKSTSVFKVNKINLEPRTARIVSPSERIFKFPASRMVSSIAAKVHISIEDDRIKNIKEARIKTAMDNFIEKNRTGELIDMGPPSNIQADVIVEKIGNSVENESHIPTNMTSPLQIPLKKLPEKSMRAPLAETESTCIENSPAIEASPILGMTDATMSTYGGTDVDTKSLSTAHDSCSTAFTFCNQSFFSSEQIHCLVGEELDDENLKTAKEASISGKEGGRTALTNVPPPDVFGNNKSTIPTATGWRGRDSGSECSLKDCLLRTAMTFSGLEDSLDKSSGKDAGSEEQFFKPATIQNSSNSDETVKTAVSSDKIVQELGDDVITTFDLMMSEMRQMIAACAGILENVHRENENLRLELAAKNVFIENLEATLSSL